MGVVLQQISLSLCKCCCMTGIDRKLCCNMYLQVPRRAERTEGGGGAEGEEEEGEGEGKKRKREGKKVEGRILLKGTVDQECSRVGAEEVGGSATATAKAYK